jgi:quercetin dioxygenase-like cupin family protein
MQGIHNNQIGPADFTLECVNLKTAQNFYLAECDFRLEMIYPADEPRVAMLAGHGIRLQLNQTGAVEGAPAEFKPELVVTARNDHSFAEGRAGMQYRDLIPGRLGGKYIASHIRIPVGGAVPDYVHHHHIQFQLIFCYQGWVRVVYEDQGPSFVMHAGDCVLQPPHIRHRVLECSDGMEVVEITCPAEHETLVEHDMELPTSSIQPKRKYGGQSFVLHRVDDCRWTTAPLAGFEMRDTGISQATTDIASAVILRAAEGTATNFTNNLALYFNFVLQGSLNLSSDDGTAFSLQAGDAFVIPPATSFSMQGISPDLQLLQVTSAG